MDSLQVRRFKVSNKNEVLSGDIMNINKENFIETTTKFNELKNKFNSDFNFATGTYLSTTEYRLEVLRNTMNEMLILLDEMVRT